MTTTHKFVCSSASLAFFVSTLVFCTVTLGFRTAIYTSFTLVSIQLLSWVIMRSHNLVSYSLTFIPSIALLPAMCSDGFPASKYAAVILWTVITAAGYFRWPEHRNSTISWTGGGMLAIVAAALAAVMSII